MYAGILSVDLLLHTRSLKEKRSVVRPLVSHLRREYAVAAAAAESGHLDLTGRTQLGVAVVAPDMAHCRDVLDRCERWLATEPHVQFVGAERRYVSDEEME
ncbi:MAG: DUF503 domain-containing protein [Candidatus Nanopelagicales bacterium]|nr:MAG: DUF503 domain-containing protein [Actinomycetota bacterium]HNO15022.1 DUF503 domain-containing protein [Actinomycetota bacterium]